MNWSALEKEKKNIGMGRILIVDNEASMRLILASNLRQDQHELWEASGVQEAQRALAANDFDVVVTDQKMPDGEGLAVLASAHEVDPTIPVILLTAVATIELAAESIVARRIRLSDQAVSTQGSCAPLSAELVSVPGFCVRTSC